MIRKICKKVLFIALLLGFLVVLVLVNFINKMINRPLLASKMTLSDRDFTEFSAVTEDGISIFACFYQGVKNASTVLLCHGHGVDMGRMDDMVKFLRVAGYNLLLLDFRAHGKSGGTLTSIGLHEWKDIKATLGAAKEKGFINENTLIAAYGRSMGAATLINGARHLPEIGAFILESSFERLRMIAARDARRHLMLPDTFFTDIVFWIIGMVTGIDYSANAPEKEVVGLGDRPVLLIHDEKDYRADINALNALKKGLPHAEVWSVADAWHVCAHERSPVEFENRFLNFLYNAGIQGRK